MSEALPAAQEPDEFRVSFPSGDGHTGPTLAMPRVTPYAGAGAPDKHRALADAVGAGAVSGAAAHALIRC